MLPRYPVKIKGRIQSMSVRGSGMNDAELVVEVEGKRGSHVLRVGSPPSTSPQLFASFTSAIAAASAMQRKARFDVAEEPDGVLRIVGVRL